MENEFYKHLNKTIPGWKGYYKINSRGQVLSLARGKGNYSRLKDKLLNVRNSANGYSYYGLSRDKKTFTLPVHRLMAQTFLINDDPINKVWVNHINGNKRDNSIVNLEWITPKDNKRHAVSSGLQVYKRGEDNKNAILNNKQIEWVRKLFANGYNKSNICEIMGVSRTLIHAIIDKGYRA